MKKWAPWLALLLVLGGALVAGTRGDGAPPTTAERVTRISRAVKCPTCSGQSAAESDAPSSVAIRDEARRLVEEGRTDAEIRAYFADRYGEDILLTPEAGGLGGIVWALPVAGAVAGGAALVFAFRRWRRTAFEGGFADDGGTTVGERALAQGRGGTDLADDDPTVVLGGTVGGVAGAPVPVSAAAGEPTGEPVGPADAAAAAGEAALRPGPAGEAAGAGTRASVAATGASAPGRGRRVMTAVAVAVVAIACGVAVAATAGERRPGEPSSGSIENADTTASRLAEARRHVEAGEALDAIKVYDEILAADPEQPEALTYRGWLLHLAGLSDQGLGYLDRAVKADPSYPDAHFFRGFILFRVKNDPAAAVTELRLFLANDPPEALVGPVETLLEEALAAAGTAPTATPSTTPTESE